MSDTLDGLRREVEANEQFRTGPLAELGRHVVALTAIGRHTAEFNSSRLYRETVAALIDCEQAQAAIVAGAGLSPEECRAAWTAWGGDLYALRYGLAAGRLRIVNGEVVEHCQPELSFDELFALSLRLMPWWRRPFARLSRAWWRAWWWTRRKLGLVWWTLQRRI